MPKEDRMKIGAIIITCAFLLVCILIFGGGW